MNRRSILMNNLIMNIKKSRTEFISVPDLHYIPYKILIHIPQIILFVSKRLIFFINTAFHESFYPVILLQSTHQFWDPVDS